MKKITTAFLTILTAMSFVFGQTQSSKIEQHQLKSGDKLKLGVGTSDNGNFKFIYTNSNELLNLPKIYLDASFSNLSVQILEIEKVGNERLGFKTMLKVWIDDDSIPTSSKKAYMAFCAEADAFDADQQKTLKYKKDDYSAKEKYLAPEVKASKEKEIEDLEKRISDYKADLEKQKEKLIKEMNLMRWIIDIESATSAGEVKK